MDITVLVMFVTELIGTVAFAVSGALVAIDRELAACISHKKGAII